MTSPASEAEILLANLSSLPGRIADQLAVLFSRTSTNLSTTFGALTVQQWIRLTIIAGAYVLFRPYLLRLVARIQGRQLESSTFDPHAAGHPDADGTVLANGKVVRRIDPVTGEEIKSKIVIPEDSDDDASDMNGQGVFATGLEWGRKAKKRQKAVVKRMLELEEKRRKEEEDMDSDQEIEDLLTG